YARGAAGGALGGETRRAAAALGQRTFSSAQLTARTCLVVLVATPSPFSCSAAVQSCNGARVRVHAAPLRSPPEREACHVCASPPENRPRYLTRRPARVRAVDLSATNQVESERRKRHRKAHDCHRRSQCGPHPAS